MKKVVGAFVVGALCLMLGLSVMWGRSEGISLADLSGELIFQHRI